MRGSFYQFEGKRYAICTIKKCACRWDCGLVIFISPPHAKARGYEVHRGTALTVPREREGERER